MGCKSLCGGACPRANIADVETVETLESPLNRIVRNNSNIAMLGGDWFGLVHWVIIAKVTVSKFPSK